MQFAPTGYFPSLQINKYESITKFPITFDTDYKYVLHVGCGPKRAEKLHSTFHTDEWKELRVDLNPAVQPDIIANIISMPKFPIMPLMLSGHPII
jgi:hypothetical protein